MTARNILTVRAILIEAMLRTKTGSEALERRNRYTGFMRRWLLLFMLVVLPMQFASAAGANYCKHETDGSKHLGHHEHQHKGSGGKTALDSSGGEVQKGSGLGDPDCEYCHLGAAHPFLQSFTASSAVPEQGPTMEPTLSFGSRDPDALERPNWAPLA
jgi:hypothetical protein